MSVSAPARDQMTNVERVEKAWRDIDGSISLAEACAIVDLIEHERPMRFLEVGTASGLSAGLIALAMNHTGGAELHCIDINTQFYGDPSKPVGFVIPEIFLGATPCVSIHTKSTSLDAPDLVGVEAVDMAFIDANHEHPWATIDTIALMPCMKPGATIIHHDLARYRQHKHEQSIGPKFLFDQIPGHLRSIVEPQEKNLFSIKVPEKRMQLAAALSASLLIPWSVKGRIPFRMIRKTRALIEAHWNASLLRVFDTAVERFY